MNQYSIAAKPVGPYASQLEASWAWQFAAWGLTARYVGDVVRHFDFALHVGQALVAVEVKPGDREQVTGYRGKHPVPCPLSPVPSSLSPVTSFVDEAIRRFARMRVARRLYDWSLPAGRVPEDRLLLVAGEPAAAEWWFAAEIAAGVWQAVRVGPPVLVLSGRGSGGGDLLKWPVDVGTRYAVDPVGSWLAETRRGRNEVTGDRGQGTGAEQEGWQRRLFA